ncbi:hypothetical protein Q1695_006205 [Nippostrongylus brasiliensis]|nr:hypothetical protein Q1695_006205 [Nippostrongylus brasiliensis]
MSADSDVPKFIKVDALKLLAACRFQGRLGSVDHQKVMKLFEDDIKHALNSADRTRKENKELSKEIKQLREERARVVVIADRDDVTSGEERPSEPSERDEEGVPKKRKIFQDDVACNVNVQ